MAPTDAALGRLRTRTKAKKRYASTMQPGDILHTPSAAFLVLAVERAPRSGWLDKFGGGGVSLDVLTEYSNGEPLQHSLVLPDHREVLVYRP